MDSDQDFAPAAFHPVVRLLVGSHQDGQAQRILDLSREHGGVVFLQFLRGNSDFAEVRFLDGAEFGIDWSGREWARN